MDQKLPSVLLAAILLVLLMSFAWNSPQFPTGSGASPGATIDGAALDRLHERIDAIARRIDALERARTSTGTTTPVIAQPASDERRPVGTGDERLDELRGQIAQIWQALASRGVETRTVTHVDLDALRQTRTDYAAVKAWCELREKHEERARQEIWLMSQDDLIRRFGRPRNLRPGESGTRVWYYATEDQNDGFEVTLFDGHVIDM